MDKKKVSALTTCQSAITKEIESFRKDASDIQMLLGHLVYIASAIASVHTASTRADPDLILHSFDGVSDALIARLLHEGQTAAYQLKYFERALEDRVMRMRRMADEAMDAVVGEECPPSRAFDELRVGMYVEIAADATSAYQAIYQLYLSYRDVLSEHLQGAPRSGPVSESWQPSSSNDDISSTTISNNKRSSSGSSSSSSSSKEWFQEAELRVAQSKWEALSSAEDERLLRWRLSNLVNSDATST